MYVCVCRERLDSTRSGVYQLSSMTALLSKRRRTDMPQQENVVIGHASAATPVLTSCCVVCVLSCRLGVTLSSRSFHSDPHKEDPRSTEKNTIQTSK